MTKITADHLAAGPLFTSPVRNQLLTIRRPRRQYARRICSAARLDHGQRSRPRSWPSGRHQPAGFERCWLQSVRAVGAVFASRHRGGPHGATAYADRVLVDLSDHYLAREYL